jgi:hypothetical protein
MIVHELEHYEDGRLAIPTLPQTLKTYVRHAAQFGTESVYETAEMEGHGSQTLARLRIELDAIEAGRKSGRFTIGKRRRRSAEETRAAVEALSVDGLVPLAIAGKLGISETRVREHLRAAA